MGVSLRAFIRRLFCRHDYRWMRVIGDEYAQVRCPKCGHEKLVPYQVPDAVRELNEWAGVEWP